MLANELAVDEMLAHAVHVEDRDGVGPGVFREVVSRLEPAVHSVGAEAVFQAEHEPDGRAARGLSMMDPSRPRAPSGLRGRIHTSRVQE